MISQIIILQKIIYRLKSLYLQKILFRIKLKKTLYKINLFLI